jgi:hypothetical protein
MRPSLLLACILSATAAAETVQERVATVTNTPGLVAFWDFTKREATGKRFTAHVPSGATSDYALDAGNYVKDLWVSVGQAWVRGQAIPLARTAR